MEPFDYTVDLASLLHPGQALLIVPPFAPIDQPALGVHLLQACAREAGLEVSVLYANILLAAAMGPAHYCAFCDDFRQKFVLAGERLFARSAHDLPPLGAWAERMYDPALILGEAKAAAIGNRPPFFPPGTGLDLPTLQRLEQLAFAWVEAVAAAVAQLPFPVVGCSTMFEQINASLALLRHIKRRRPRVHTLLGGANCAGDLAHGLAALDPRQEYVDTIFSGESEATFPAFLQDLAAGRLPPGRILIGAPCQDLDALPLPDFREYFEQRDRYLPGDQAPAWLCYETSRGCWWGQQQRCTFCGLNGEHVAFRQKSAPRACADLQRLAETYPAARVTMTDCVMPPTYFQTLLPALAEAALPLEVKYEQKADLALQQVLSLKKAGVSFIAAGVESFSSSLLRRMRKGVLARQNIMLLRYARAAGLDVAWLLLWGFPGDEREVYEQTLALIPLMHHLPPPALVNHLFIARFSPYFEQPAAYGLRDVRPHGAYAAVLPAHVDAARLASYFVADYESAAYAHMDLIEEIMRQVGIWRERWSSAQAVPLLGVAPAGDAYLLLDTRALPGTLPLQALDRTRAAVALTARPYAESADVTWAIANKLGVHVDGWYVPLATADPGLLAAFEAEL